MDADDWTYNCPQYVDFTSGDDVLGDDVESYFAYDHENGGMPVHFGNDATPGLLNLTDAFETPPSGMTRSKTALLSSIKGDTCKENITPQSQNVPPARTRSSGKKVSGDICRNITPQSHNVPPVRTRSSGKQVSVNTPERINSACSPAVTLKPLKVKTPNTVEREYAAEVANKSARNRNKRSLQQSPERHESHAKRIRSATPEGQSAPKSSGLRRSMSQRSTRSRTESGSQSESRSESASKRQKHSAPQTRSGISQPSGLRRSRSVRHVRAGSADRHIVTEAQNCTIPTTPTLLKRQPVKLASQPPLKNSEQLELEKIAYYRQELAKKRKLAQESHKKALTAKGPQACTVPKKEPTKPHEFHFETDNRLKPYAGNAPDKSETRDFCMTLRSEAVKVSKATIPKSGVTKPEPFKLTEGCKRKGEPGKEDKYESMAQRVAAFNATPDRFKSRPKATRGRSRSPPHDITVPKTPQFETRSRARPVTAPTREQLEEKEIEEMKKNQFKAHGVNARILTRSETGIKKVPSKPSTVPEEFHLSSKNKRNVKEDKPSEDHYEFHAQPLNKKILQGTVGVKEAKPKAPTVPASPAFALKHRVRLPVEVKEKETAPVPISRAVPHHGIPFQPRLDHKTTQPEPFTFDESDRHRSALRARKVEQKRAEEAQVEEKVVKAHPVPHSGIPFQPKLSHKVTVLEPFGFDERDKVMLARKEEKIHEILENESKMHEFQANPLPCHEPHLPPKKARPVTKQEPFNLNTETRGMKKAEEWSAKLEEELQQQRLNAAFKAQKPKVLEHEPFQPLVDHKHTTDVNEFEFNTAKRSVKREAYETFKKSRQDEIDNVRHQVQLAKEAERKAEEERQRREAVHHANPVKQYKPVIVKRSNKPPTEPISPKFKTDSRLRSRGRFDESS